MKVSFKETSRGIFYKVFRRGKLMEEGLAPSREFKIMRIMGDYRIARTQIKEVEQDGTVYKR